MYVAADKTTNICKINVGDYKKLLRDNVTLTYKKVDKSQIKKINQDSGPEFNSCPRQLTAKLSNLKNIQTLTVP